MGRVVQILPHHIYIPSSETPEFLGDGIKMSDVAACNYDGPALLPQARVVFTVPTVNNTITVKSSGGDYTTLQSAWNSISDRSVNGGGYEIVIDAGYDPGDLSTGAQTGDDTYWVIIRSANSASLPRHIRVGPTDKSDMPQMVNPAGQGTIEIGSSTARVRFIGLSLEFTTGSYLSHATRINNGAEYIIYDRCLIEGEGISQNVVRGMSLSGSNIGVIDSYIYNITHTGADNQGIWIYEGAGPFTIVNCFIEAAGMSFMAGGANPSAEAYLPYDITISRCYMYKNPTWSSTPSLVVKNIFELKLGVRVLVEDCIMENFWLPDQDTAINIKTVNQGSDPSKTWIETGHVTMRWIKLMDAPCGFKLNGLPEAPGVKAHDISIHDILMYDLGAYSTVDSGYQDGHQVFMSDMQGKVRITNLTSIFAGTNGHMLEFDGSPNNDLFFKDNIMAYAAYGVKGSGYGSGTASLNHFCTTHDFDYNQMYGTGTAPDISGYPNNTTNEAWDDIDACGFENPGSDDYRLSAGSSLKGEGSYGSDPGCDVAALNTRLTHVDDGDFSGDPWET